MILLINLRTQLYSYAANEYLITKWKILFSNNKIIYNIITAR